MNIRHTLAPQMKDYDKLGLYWLPYVMFLSPPHFQSNSIHTDQNGFRYTIDRQGERLGSVFAPNQTMSIFAGGSAAFGVGATSDHFTIPSLLNRSQQHPFINLAGRAHSSTQELLSFQFFSSAMSVKRVIIYSGLNDLFLHFLSPARNTILGSFFHASWFYRAMYRIMLSPKRKLLQSIFAKLLPREFKFEECSLKDICFALFSTPQSPTESHGSNSDISNVIAIIDRNLSIWKALATSRGFDLQYVLQPVADWIPRTPSTQEDQIFKYLSLEKGNPWTVFKEEMASPARHQWYANAIQEICRNLHIPFLDMNQCFANSKTDGEWIFVDRVHLTDQGSRLVVQYLEKLEYPL